VLVVTDDTLGKTMAGPGIRAFEMAKAISRVAMVRLASTVPVDLSHRDFDVVYSTRSDLKKLVAWSDVVVFQGALLSTQPWLARSSKVIVADIYDPMHLEVLEQLRAVPEGRRYLETLDITAVMNEQIRRADFMVCASEKQRDFWLGQLAALGRLNPFTYDADSAVRSLIDIVPFGVQDQAPVQVAHGIKGTIPGIAETDKVILWGGGIYNWFDPLTLIRAISILAERHDDVRLVFMGTQHPNPHVPEMKMSFQSRELADELGLVGRSVFFNEGWVPYAERANFLLDADVGVSTHLEHLETAFSFRTRLLDYFWCGLPTVATKGDTFESIIDAHELGITVPPGDVEALVLALETILYTPGAAESYRSRVTEYAQSLRWEVILAPLVEFVKNPQRAADALDGYPVRLAKFESLGRRSLRQRIFVFALSSKMSGFSYTFGLVANNLRRKIRTRLGLSPSE